MRQLRIIPVLAAILATTGPVRADERAGYPTPFPEIANPEKAGQELAAELRGSGVTEATELSGMLRRRIDGEWTTDIPVSFRLIPGVTGWQTIYETAAVGSIPAERFVAIHTPGQANEYLLARASAVGSPLPTPVRITAEQAAAPLAGTDFWLSDLGLEFLQWPGQRVLRYEMRRSRVCRVLESIPPSGSKTGYSRILSWIDREYNKPLQAEGYDEQGRLFKEFSVRSIKKVEGVYQVKDMDIRNLSTGSLTRLEFELTAK